MTSDEDPSVLWAQDAQLLAEVGRHLFDQDTRVQVRLPRAMAAAAVARWEGDGDDRPLAPATDVQRAVRHQAGTLGLIGLCVQNSGVEDGNDIVVDMPSWYIGLALEAAGDAGLIGPPGPEG